MNANQCRFGARRPTLKGAADPRGPNLGPCLNDTDARSGDTRRHSNGPDDSNDSGGSGQQRCNPPWNRLSDIQGRNRAAAGGKRCCKAVDQCSRRRDLGQCSRF